jgi:hypothetical protein
MFQIRAVLLMNHVKIEVKFSLCLINHYAMQGYGGVEVKLHTFLITAKDGDEWSASRSTGFTPGKGQRYTLDRRPGGSHTL